MFVELIYDKRNFAGLPGARETILNELTKRMQRIFRGEAEVREADDDAAGDQHRRQQA
jgi:hypothetical protein